MRIVLQGPNAILALREYWKREILVIYGYYIRVGSYEEWWDNGPHRLEIETFPYHRYVREKVGSLQNSSLEEFPRRAKELLSLKNQDRENLMRRARRNSRTQRPQAYLCSVKN